MFNHRPSTISSLLRSRQRPNNRAETGLESARTGVSARDMARIDMAQMRALAGVGEPGLVPYQVVLGLAREQPRPSVK